MKAKNPGEFTRRGFYAYCLLLSLTITYFHTGCSTIIGAKSFHGPVRDGKGWDRLAMVIRHDLYELRVLADHGLRIWKKQVLGSDCRTNKQHTVFL